MKRLVFGILLIVVGALIVVAPSSATDEGDQQSVDAAVVPSKDDGSSVDQPSLSPEQIAAAEDAVANHPQIKEITGGNYAVEFGPWQDYEGGPVRGAVGAVILDAPVDVAEIQWPVVRYPDEGKETGVESRAYQSETIEASANRVATLMRTNYRRDAGYPRLFCSLSTRPAHEGCS